ncbi:MAG: lamin tail domain-containing protein [Bacteroidales bacterium]|nr:lamin tail domain-containing protein [Lentimicrobiaceae bacterium]MDD5694173.1 lamin tail domain-containing protein [Bacteroidales bacterium]
MKRTIFIILSLVTLTTRAQLVDDFSDGNFSSDPEWIGQSESFRVNPEGQLQLFTSGSGTAALATASVLCDSTEWHFRIKMGFSPSSNNFARVYLAADQPDLSGILNGYYLQFGESGAGDALELFRQEGMNSTSICRGREGSISTSFSLKIKVIHKGNGIWEIFSAAESAPVLQSEASGSDDFPCTAGYFGFLCTFTSSNSQKFYFDDFMIQPVQKDTVAPFVEQIQAVTVNRLDIFFSEMVNESDAVNPNHYRLVSNGETPYAASLDAMDQRRVILQFSSYFSNGSEGELRIGNIHDRAGNCMMDTILRFSFYQPQAFDILINEIMADPDPSSSLPPVEYIELYNACQWPVNLEGWSVCIADKPKVFPQINLTSGGYLLVTRDQELNAFGFLVPLLSSSYALSNEGTSLALTNSSGQLIHAVKYTVDWCRDDWKKEGGWSLELIDPLNPCGEEGNWSVCTDPMGGTPGRMNSVTDKNRDTLSPRLSGIGIESNEKIRIWFSEKVDSIVLLNPMNYRLDPVGIPPLSTCSAGDYYRSVRVRFTMPLQEQVTYQLVVTDTIMDCAGNCLPPGATMPLGIPSIAGNMDMVINEILLNPKEDGAEFIEIYNRSDRFFDLSDLVIARLDTVSQLLTYVQTIREESYLLAPGHYQVLTPDPGAVCRQYHCSDPDAFIEMTTWPSFSQVASVIVLANKHDELIIDQVQYNESLHFDLFSNLDGVSLERIHFNRSSDDPTNWHSASRSSGFATPGYQNSQFMDNITASDQWLTVEPELFTPDNDGVDDLLAVFCSAVEPGFVANVQVFDAEGMRIRNLADNALMGMNNAFTWDGKDDSGVRMRSGIYVIYARIFDLKGQGKAAKRACVLVNQQLR